MENNTCWLVELTELTHLAVDYCVRVHVTFHNILFHLDTKAVLVHHDKFITNNK